MLLDPSVARIVEATADFANLDLAALPKAEAVAIARSTPVRPAGGDDLVVTDDRTIDGVQGEVPIRIYRPASVHEPLPLLMHLHGGGFVSGSIEQDDARCRSLAAMTPCRIVSVGYRRAPEHRFPAALEDAFAAWRWITSNAELLGGDQRLVAISGSSAGGHIAVGVTLLARQRGAPLPLLQLLTYPVITPRLDSASYARFASGPFLTKARMAWYWKQYLGEEAATADPLVDLLLTEASGLPPAHVITAEYDVLRDEGEAYAEYLERAGVTASVERHPGMIHGFVSIVPDHPASQAALTGSARVLSEAFERQRVCSAPR